MSTEDNDDSGRYSGHSSHISDAIPASIRRPREVTAPTVVPAEGLSSNPDDIRGAISNIVDAVMDVVLNHHLVDADDHPDMERAILELSRNVRGILTGAPTSLPPGNVVRLHETQPSLIKDLVHLFDSLVKLQFSVGVMKFEEHDLEMLQQCVAASNEIKVGMEMSREKTKEKERQQ